MLINLSNHPKSSWSQKQLDAAKVYGEVVDMQFPQIHPEATLRDVKKTVKLYINKIIKLNPTAVHIQGEQVFVYLLVNVLRELGIMCVASTSKRLRIKNKSTRNNREFGMFRNYFV